MCSYAQSCLLIISKKQLISLHPSLWVGVHDTVEIVAKKLKVPILHIEEFKEKVCDIFNNVKMTLPCGQNVLRRLSL